MSVPVRTTAPTAPDDLGAVFDALATAMAQAADYADMAARFAAHRDPRGCAYAVRCASAALLSAAGLVEEVRPSRQPEPSAA